MTTRSRLCPITVLLSLLLACGSNPGADDAAPPADAVEVGTDALEVGPDASPADVTPPSRYVYDVPLDPDSPWPKFRRDAAQRGLAPFALTDDGAAPWSYRTGKGIFSSPVIDGNGTVYVGSADRTFYALDVDGGVRWRFETGEIIDSAALLDDRGRVYVASGDGRLYALEAGTGALAWTFEADDPSVNSAFINWFEGNVGLAPDGTLLAPNDNFFVYGVDRDSGAASLRLKLADQTWALPAVDAAGGRLFVANNNVLPGKGNTFGYALGGERLWKQQAGGTVAASPLFTGDAVVVGAFDGFVRAHAPADGAVTWSAEARDHVYASAALHPDGFVVVPAADGTVYALDPSDGSVTWAYDWGAPLRSSPAVDGEGTIYVGTGDGHLLVLNRDGSRRWALRLIHEDRDDVNASPALEPHAVVVAGESGEIFRVPADFCLRVAEAANPDCLTGPGEPLPDEGAFVLFTTPFGSTLSEPPAAIDANRMLAFSLGVRAAGDTRLALLDRASLQVTVAPDVPFAVDVSANRQFLTLRPEALWQAGASGSLTLRVKGDYLVDPVREGLATSGGTVGGSFDRSFTFTLNAPGPAALPLPIPASPGAPQGVWEWSRLAASLPTLLPSYNQIGFDSHHFLIGLVEGDDRHAVAWVVQAQPSGPGGEVAPDPATRGVFPFEVSNDQGRVTFSAGQGMGLEVQSIVLSFSTFRLAAALDANGDATDAAGVFASTLCRDIPVYGYFVRELGLCNPDDDLLLAWGAVLLESRGTAGAPAGVGEVAFAVADDHVTATLAGSSLTPASALVSLLLVDAATGRPVTLPYGLDTTRATAADGTLTGVTLPFEPGSVPARVRAYLMVGTYPAAVATLDLP